MKSANRTACCDRGRGRLSDIPLHSVVSFVRPACAEIIVIGNELLLGEVLDTNSQWLCRQISGIGGVVTRVTVIGDHDQTIAEEIAAALKRSPALLILSGGLGPTDDDLTLRALAEAIGQPLRLNEQAEAMVATAYGALCEAGMVSTAEMNEPRRKMALLPEGGTPLANPVGAAPGVLLTVSSTSLVALPGVPEELKGIFETSLTPLLTANFGDGVSRQTTVTVNCGDESAMAEALRITAQRHPRVYVKSRARTYGSDLRLNITLQTSASDAATAEAQLNSAANSLRAELATLGITIHQIQ